MGWRSAWASKIDPFCPPRAGFVIMAQSIKTSFFASLAEHIGLGRRLRNAVAGLACIAAVSALAATEPPARPQINPQPGPRMVKLGDQGSLDLPAGFVYLSPEDAQAMMTYWGNPGEHKTLGMVLGEKSDDDWAITLEFRNEGYVKDEDAKTWNAKELFDSLKEGTEASNEERKRLGGGEMHLKDWVQRPVYDATHHRLAWGILADVNDNGQTSQAVNYRTYVLGRQGFIEMNLMTDPLSLGDAQKQAQELLAVTRFNEGLRYEDFKADTDSTAAYGLAALVVGGAAKKLGLLAGLGLLFAKFWKLIILAFALVGGGVAKLFKRK